jgi:methylmalonyl-CoA epimerase
MPNVRKSYDISIKTRKKNADQTDLGNLMKYQEDGGMEGVIGGYLSRQLEYSRDDKGHVRAVLISLVTPIYRKSVPQTLFRHLTIDNRNLSNLDVNEKVSSATSSLSKVGGQYWMNRVRELTDNTSGWLKEGVMAKIIRIDHIAVAVRDVESSVTNYQKILGAELISTGEICIRGNKAKAAYLKLGDNVIVLDGAVEPDGFLAKFIEKRGEGLHHIGVVVDDLDEFAGELEAKGVRIPHRESFGDARREILLSPKDLSGVVIQVIEWKEGDYPTFEQRTDRLKRFLTREP